MWGFFFGLLGIRSLWREYNYQKASVVAKAKILSIEIKDIRTNGNYYLKPTHRITYQLVFFRDGMMDTLTDTSSFLLYTEGKTSKNPNPIPTIKQLMKQERYVRYVPESKKKETVFADRIHINNNGSYESNNKFQAFFSMIIFVSLGYFIRYFNK